MANYYTIFVFAIRINAKEAKWLERLKQLDPSVGEDIKILKYEYGIDLDGSPLDFRIDIEKASRGFSARFTTEESGTPDIAADILQAMLKKFRPNGCAGFAWAETCGSMRTDGFGGGGCFITANRIKWMSGTMFVANETQKFSRDGGR